MPLIVNDVLACAAGSAPSRLAVTLGDEGMTFGPGAPGRDPGRGEDDLRRGADSGQPLRQCPPRPRCAAGGARGVVVGDDAFGSGALLRLEPHRHGVRSPQPRLLRRRGGRGTRLPAAPVPDRRPDPRGAGRAARRRPPDAPAHRGRWAYRAARGGPQRTSGGGVARRAGRAAARGRCHLHHLLDQREHGAPQGGDGLPARHVATDPRRRRRPLDDRRGRRARLLPPLPHGGLEFFHDGLVGRARRAPGP